MSAAAKALDALEAAGKTLHNAKDGLAWRIASDELHSLRVNLASPLAAVARAAMAHVAQMDANDKHVTDCESIGSSPSSVGAVRAIKTLASLRAALDALEAAAMQGGGA